MSASSSGTTSGTLVGADAARRTRVRLLIVLMLFAATTINYADRATISIAGPDMAKELGLTPTTRPVVGGTEAFVTDNGNLTLDCACGTPLKDGAMSRALEQAILEIPGVVDTGLFLGTAERVLIGYADGRVAVRTP